MADTKSKQKTKNATKSNTTKRTSSSKATTKTHERDVRVVATDAAYALAGIANDAFQFASETLHTGRHLPQRVRGTNRDDLEERFTELRERAEKRFDDKATKGRTVTDDLLKNGQLKPVVEQAKNAQTQVKAALTSIRRTANETLEAGFSAGREQASSARTQAKAAATSVQKTASAAFDAGRQAANGTETKKAS